MQRLTYASAEALFAGRGVQPGQPLPKLSLVDIDGQPVDLNARRAGRPMVIVTCSLTCNVARRNQPKVAELARRLGDRALVVTLYTIDAHPAGDACPYTGTEWVPPANDTDGVLVRQPTNLAERLQLAARYRADWADGDVVVDTFDDASWHALGQAPNLGLLVDADGIVRERCGWFDATRLFTAFEQLGR
jgi:hypothetical protein